jgi:hypothetical protein
VVRAHPTVPHIILSNKNSALGDFRLTVSVDYIFVQADCKQGDKFRCCGLSNSPPLISAFGRTDGRGWRNRRGIRSRCGVGLLPPLHSTIFLSMIN